jgi:hypothetical protein
MNEIFEINEKSFNPICLIISLIPVQTKKLNSEPNDEECDATGDAMKNKSWLHNQ